MSPETQATVQLLGNLIREVGFPIVVAGYLLLKVTPALTRLTAAVEKLADRMTVTGWPPPGK